MAVDPDRERAVVVSAPGALSQRVECSSCGRPHLATELAAERHPECPFCGSRRMRQRPVERR